MSLRVGRGGIDNRIKIAQALSGSNPTIDVDDQSVDTNVELAIRAKGTGAVQMGAEKANYLEMVGAAASSAPVCRAAGSDTNIGITLTPKGTGVVNVATDDLTINSLIVQPYVHAVANIAAGATATDYDGLFFIANRAYEVVSVTERHAVAGSDAGAVTLMVKKVPSGTAKASGTDTLASGINLKGTADTNASGTLHATQADYQLASGNALGLVPTGTLTAVDGVTVHVVLKAI